MNRQAKPATDEECDECQHEQRKTRLTTQVAIAALGIALLVSVVANVVRSNVADQAREHHAREVELLRAISAAEHTHTQLLGQILERLPMPED